MNSRIASGAHRQFTLGGARRRAAALASEGSNRALESGQLCGAEWTSTSTSTSPSTSTKMGRRSMQLCSRILLVAEGLHGIDSGGSERGHVPGGQGNQREHDCRQDHHERVVSLEFKEK